MSIFPEFRLPSIWKPFFTEAKSREEFQRDIKQIHKVKIAQSGAIAVITAVSSSLLQGFLPTTVAALSGLWIILAPRMLTLGGQSLEKFRDEDSHLTGVVSRLKNYLDRHPEFPRPQIQVVSGGSVPLSLLGQTIIIPRDAVSEIGEEGLEVLVRTKLGRLNLTKNRVQLVAWTLFLGSVMAQRVNTFAILFLINLSALILRGMVEQFDFKEADRFAVVTIEEGPKKLTKHLMDLHSPIGLFGRHLSGNEQLQMVDVIDPLWSGTVLGEAPTTLQRITWIGDGEISQDFSVKQQLKELARFLQTPFFGVSERVHRALSSIQRNAETR